MLGKLNSHAQIFAIDTTIESGVPLKFFVNSKGDYRNTDKYHPNYFPAVPNLCSDYVPFRDLLDTFILSNNSNSYIDDIYFAFNGENAYDHDSLIANIFCDTCDAKRNALAVYKYITAKHLYYYANDKADSIYENYNTNKFLNVYGTGNCGMIASAVSHLAARYTGKNQRFWYVNYGAHGVSEINFDSTWQYIDADQSGFYLRNDNKTLASYNDVVLDGYLYLRNKHLDRLVPYNYASNQNFYAFPSIGNYINNTDSTLNINTSCCPKNHSLLGEKIRFSLKPYCKLIFMPNDTVSRYHFVHTQPKPSLNTVLLNYATAQLRSTIVDSTSGQLVAPDSVFALALDSSNNSQSMLVGSNYSFSTYKLALPFAINASKLILTASRNTTLDSLSVLYSLDGISWSKATAPNLNSNLGKQTTTISLDTLINPYKKAAVYSFFVKIELRSPSSSALLHAAYAVTESQYSKLSGPRLVAGDNEIALYYNGSSNLEAQIRYFTWNSNNAPDSAMSAIFPPNGAFVDSTAFTFRWSVPTDLDGDTIFDYHIQVSDRADFAYPVATIFDRQLRIVNGGKNFFRPEVTDYFNTGTTYFWRTRARDQKGMWSKWSATNSFSVAATMPPRNLRWELATPNADSLTLKWDRSLAGVKEDFFNVYATNIMPVMPYAPNIVGVTTDTSFTISANQFGPRFRITANRANGVQSAASTFILKPINSLGFIGSAFDPIAFVQPNIAQTQLPYPNVDVTWRNLFVLYDSNYFVKNQSGLLESYAIGKSLVDICTKIGDDTVRVFQLLHEVKPSNIGNPISLYNFVFTDVLWNVDTNKQISASINDTTELFAMYDSYKFTSSDFYGAFEKLIVDNNLSNNLLVVPQNRTLNFELNGKAAQSYSAFFPRAVADTSTAIYLIPGSGINQTSQMINLASNYHNIGCYMLNFLTGYGDVYYQVKPNEDWRAHWRNVAGVNRKVNELGLIQGLQGYGRPYAANYMIEALATIKYLQSKYDKVIVIGLSQGGTAALLSGLQCEPAGVYCASGYSTLFDNAFPASNSNQLYFDSLYAKYTASNIYANIDSLSTNFLFTWNTNEGVYFSDYEAQTSTTKNFLLPLNNVQSSNSFFANGSHTFNCGALASFISDVKAKPTVSLHPNYTACLSDSLTIALKMKGVAPFTVVVQHNGADVDTLIVNALDTTVAVYQSGYYRISKIWSAVGVEGFATDSIYYQKDLPVNAQLSSRNYLCAIDSTLLSYAIQANALAEVTYLYNGVTNTTLVADGNFSKLLQRGEFQITHIEDQKGCVADSFSGVRVADTVLSATNPIVSWLCTTGQTSVHFDVSGNPPFSVSYLESNIAKTITSNVNHISIPVADSALVFISTITDSTQCTQPILYNTLVQFAAASCAISSPNYNCADTLTDITITVSGNLPFEVFYKRDGIVDSFFVSTNTYVKQVNNGFYQFLFARDANNCTIPLSDSFDIDYQASILNVQALAFDCGTSLTPILISGSGNGPFAIDYQLNGGIQSLLVPMLPFDTLLPAGDYFFQTAVDSTSCVSNIFKSITIDADTIGVNYSSVSYDCSVAKAERHWWLQGNAPFVLRFLFNNVADSVIINGDSIVTSLSNGIYNFTELVDATGCAISLNVVDTIDFHSLAVNFNLLPFDCATAKTPLNISGTGNGPFSLTYQVNGQGEILQIASLPFDTLLSPGSYLFQTANDATNCELSLIQPIVLSTDSIDVSFTPISYNCSTAFAERTWSFQGNLPFVLRYLYNGAADSFVVNSYSITTSLINGTYHFIEVVDGSGCTWPLGLQDTIDFSELSFVSTVLPFDCASNLTPVAINADGNFPLTLYYWRGVQFDSLVVASAQQTSLWPSENFILSLLSDKLGCSLSLGQSITINTAELVVSNSSPQYNCSTNSTEIAWQLQGNAPFTVHFLKNGVLDSMVLPIGNTTTHHSNGTYQFIDVVDSTNCSELLVGHSYIFDKYPVYCTITQQPFNCADGSNSVYIACSGNSPFTIKFLRNNVLDSLAIAGNTLDTVLANGQYNFISCIDANGCDFAINQAVSISGVVTKFKNVDFNLDCNTHLVDVTIDVEGNFPITLDYLLGVVPTTINLYDSTTTFTVVQDSIKLLSIIDAKGCVIQLSEQYVNYFDSIEFYNSYQSYNCLAKKHLMHFDLEGTAPYTLTGLVGGVPFTWSFGSSTLDTLISNGEFIYTSLSDASGCQIQLQQASVLSSDSLGYITTNVYNDCSLYKQTREFQVSGNFPIILQWKNLVNGDLFADTTYAPTLVHSFSKGLYALIGMQDALCFTVIADTFVVDIDSIVLSFSPILTDCEQKTRYIQVQANDGNLPYKLFYSVNAVLDSVTILDTMAFKFYLPNGSLTFLSVQNVFGCSHPLQATYIAPYEPIEITNITESYICGVDSTKITLAINSSSPCTLLYDLDGTTASVPIAGTSYSLYTTNGLIDSIMLVDGFGCSRIFDTSIVIDNSAASVSFSRLDTLCELQAIACYFNLSGEQPIKLAMLRFGSNTIDYKLVDNDSLHLSCGTYTLFGIEDANGCYAALDTNLYVKCFEQQHPAIEQIGTRLNALTVFSPNWFYENQLVAAGVESLLANQQGDYWYNVIDSNGCTLNSDTIAITNTANLQVFPTHTNGVVYIVASDTSNFALQSIVVTDVQGRVVKSDYNVLGRNVFSIDLQALAVGIYHVSIQYTRNNASFRQNSKIRRQAF
ncbi:MAG: hypothetical protein RL660_611 [Bacteroidota bacterium]